MKRNIYCGVACGLLAAALIYPCEPLCWLASIVCICLSGWFLQRAERQTKIIHNS